MAQTYLDLLPEEIRCEIYKYPTSFQSINALEAVNPGEVDIIKDCLQVLEGEDEADLTPDWVLSLPKIRVISNAYPILIQDGDQLIALAQKESLLEASFDLTNILNQVQEIYDYIMIFEYYAESHLDETSSNCKNCAGDNPSYKFTFFYTDDDIHIVEVSEGGIFLINPVYEPVIEFYSELPNYIPICEYRGPFEDTSFGIEVLPCLEKVYFKFILGSRLELNPEDLLSPILGRNNVKEYFLSFKKEEISKVNDMISIFITKEDSYTQIHPQVTTFLPVPNPTIGLLMLKIFPNLTSITLLPKSFRVYSPGIIEEVGMTRGVPNFLEFTKRLNNFATIYCVDDGNSKQELLNVFPKNIQDKVIFQEPDWLA